MMLSGGTASEDMEPSVPGFRERVAAAAALRAASAVVREAEPPAPVSLPTPRAVRRAAAAGPSSAPAAAR
ncbi:hypothetical protein AB0910_28850 [Streptomyces sp. NPDC047002]|uniref:hypothetical protein n=1 Tax=Streptomyces sp. NPDC047002 TaxID=3155475 RepID=UPI003456402C